MGALPETPALFTSDTKEMPPGLDKGLATQAYLVLKEFGPMKASILEQKIRQRSDEAFLSGGVRLAFRRGKNLFKRSPGDKWAIKTPEA